MARVQTFLPFDQKEVDLNELYWGDSAFYNNQDLEILGRTYEDLQMVEYDVAGLYFLNVVAGHGLRANGRGEIVSGTVTGFFQAASINGEDYYDHLYVTGISVSGAEFYRATSTSGTQDDHELFGRALAGNDRFDLGGYQDRAQGYAGNDLMFGNGGNDTLEGGQGDDKLLGGAGVDGLLGGAGQDQLTGGAGNDRLMGGTGTDRLTGGVGADAFIFATISDLGLRPGTTDTITDFTRGQDRIDLSRIDAASGWAGDQAFQFNGRAGIGISGHGEVSFRTYDRAGTADDMTVISIDVDGDPAAEAVIRLNGVHNLTANDFIL